MSQVKELSTNAAKRIALPVGVTGSTYMISVRVRTGFGYVSFKNDSERAKIIKENGGKSSDTLPLFEAYVHGQDAAADELSSASEETAAPKRKSRKQMISISNSGTVLSTMIDRLQAKMICSGSERWWFFAETEAAAIEEGLAGVNATLTDLLEELDKYHDDAYALYQRRLGNILGKLNRLEEMPEFLAKFPTRQQIRESFRVEVEGPIRVPSAMELAQEVNPDFKSWMQQLHTQIQRDVPRLSDEICGAVADFLSRIESADPENLKQVQSEALTKAYERIQALQALYASMNQVKVAGDEIEALLVRAGQLATAFTSKRYNRDQMFRYLVDYKSELRQSEALVSGSGKGSKALARWTGIVSIEDRMKALRAEIAESKKATDLSDGDRMAQTAALQIRVKSMADLLGVAASQLMESIDLPPAPSVQQELLVAEVEVVEEVTETQVDIHPQVAEAGF